MKKAKPMLNDRSTLEWSSFPCSLGSLPFLSTTYIGFFKVSWRRTRWSITSRHKAVVTTTIRLRYDCNSTTIRPFDDLRHDRAAALWPKQAVRVATQYAPAPLLPRGRQSATRAAEQTQRSSNFPMPNTFPRWPLQPPYALRPRWVKRPGDLDLWPLTSKVVSQSPVTWAISVRILVFLGLSVLDLGPMYATDRHTDVRRQTKALHNK